jgi:hypothetical protein
MIIILLAAVSSGLATSIAVLALNPPMALISGMFVATSTSALVGALLAYRRADEQCTGCEVEDEEVIASRTGAEFDQDNTPAAAVANQHKAA